MTLKSARLANTSYSLRLYEVEELHMSLSFDLAGVTAKPSLTTAPTAFAVTL